MKRKFTKFDLISSEFNFVHEKAIMVKLNKNENSSQRMENEKAKVS